MKDAVQRYKEMVEEINHYDGTDLRSLWYAGGWFVGIRHHSYKYTAHLDGSHIKDLNLREAWLLGIDDGKGDFEEGSFSA